VLLLAADLLLAAWAATQYLAHRLANQPNLGPWLVAAAAVVLGGPLAGGVGLRLVLTPSGPRSVYRTVAGTPVRGDVVMACLPEPVAQLALQRGYLWRGECPGGVVPLGKVVLGVQGDTVTLGAAGIALNGRAVPNSRPCERDGRGRPLAHYPYGTHVLGQGELRLVSPYHPRSFDSRYFGPVASVGVISRLVPVWSWGEASVMPSLDASASDAIRAGCRHESAAPRLRGAEHATILRRWVDHRAWYPVRCRRRDRRPAVSAASSCCRGDNSIWPPRERGTCVAFRATGNDLNVVHVRPAAPLLTTILLVFARANS
jgi:conjugative transfer signal peptidase TraF